MAKEGNVCCICNDNFKVRQFNNSGKLYCNKHYVQMYRYGKVSKTVKDKNEIIKYSDYAELVMVGKNLEETGRVKVSLNVLSTVQNYKWYLTSAGYACNRITKKAILLHRLIMDAKDDEVVDHINRDKLDCRNENLRIGTQSQNAMNSSLSKRNTSGVTGVWYNNKRNKWVAEIFAKGKKYSLGTYVYKEDAIKARKNAEQKYFGEFAPDRSDD